MDWNKLPEYEILPQLERTENLPFMDSDVNLTDHNILILIYKPLYLPNIPILDSKDALKHI